MRRIFLNICSAVAVAIMASMAVSCVEDVWLDEGFEPSDNKVVNHGPRESEDERRNVLLLYSAGYNSIASYLKDDAMELETGYLPGEGRNQDVVLVYSHLPVRDYEYKTPTSPILYKLYKDENQNVVRDTLLVYAAGTHSATAAQLHEVLSFVKDKFPAKTYGMIFSSHATGYLPAGYYSSPSDGLYDLQSFRRRGWRRMTADPVPYVEVPDDPSLPAVRSVGQDEVYEDGRRVSYEIEIEEFADAIPMQLDYILFDACLMGGIEVAYELAGKCHAVGFSQAEVLAEGLDYRTLTSHLLKTVPDPMAVCKDYYEQYRNKTDTEQSATISYIDCTALEPLAEVCETLFEKYRTGLEEIRPSNVQRYYRNNCHWFYDLQSIVRNAGADSADMQLLADALNECVLYKAATPRFMNSFGIYEHSGFSMYLPCNGGPNLDRYYKGLAWNIRTGLVE